ncbi:hypothetical protein D9M71_401550 [compost metagenome]
MREERFEFFPVGVLLLDIDMPEQRAPCPLRANERVFTAHGIEVAAPQQLIVVILTDKRQDLHGQGATPCQLARLQVTVAQPGLHIPQNTPLGHQQMVVTSVGGQRIEPAGQARVLVGEQ